MFSYLDTATNFQDIQTREIPTQSHPTFTTPCPKCKGYGRWNLRLNAYGEGVHFQANCNQCNGWGWVDPNSQNATCLHEVKEIGKDRCRKLGIAHYGRCWHVYECQKCGHAYAVDSSD